MYGILNNINPNKAMGPDKIHGKILKNCALLLPKLLSYLFTKSYYGMSIPDKWNADSAFHLSVVYKIPYRRAPRLAYRLHRPSASREQRYLAYNRISCSCIQDTLSSRAALGLPAECVARAKVSCIQQLFQFTRKDINQMFKTIAQSH